jgi:integrase/recombinase XerD
MRRKRTLPKYLTTEEIESLFSVIEDVRDGAIFRVAYHRGLRASEIGVLKLADYRPDVGRLYVRRLKGSNSGEFLLTDVENRSLLAWIDERGRVAGPLFPSRNRGPISRDRLDDLIETILPVRRDRTGEGPHAQPEAQLRHASFRTREGRSLDP